MRQRLIVSYAVSGAARSVASRSPGIGRVHGAEGLREFSQVKSVVGQRVSTPREVWWFPVPKNLDKMGIATLRLRFGKGLKAKLGRR